MNLAGGTRLGTYEITGSLGAGGMGEVYRARDTKLGRDVALKILPDIFAADPDRLARFEREAQVLASLNHPHIAQIHGLEDTQQTRALVMELVEGEDLSQRLARGPLTIDDTIAIARQIADALEAAHEQGIVHRDLKPANIKIRPDGAVKVLDFGLAKALAPAEAGAIQNSPYHGPGFLGAEALAQAASRGTANSPTITTPAMTQAGIIMGTAAYMSPEQARGRAVDKRADIWAFGCVLYEMLTGQRAFEGETVTDMLAAVVTRDPDWGALPATTPANVRQLVARCLVKDPRRRFRDIGDVRNELEVDQASPTAPVTPLPVVSKRQRIVPWLVAAISFMLAAVAVFFVWRARDVEHAGPVRFRIQPPESAATGDVPGTMRSLGHISLSPDGQRVALLSTAPGGRLWIRDLQALEPVQIRGTESAVEPFWSPDGRAIAFFTPGQLKVVDLATGAVQAVTATSGPRGGTWNREGIILLADESRRAIHRIPARGGNAEPVTALDASRGDMRHAWPVFLDDGRRFLFLNLTKDPTTTGIYLGSLDSNDTQFLAQATSNGAYAPPGFLVFTRGSMLFAQPIDLDRGVATGDAATVAQQVAYNASVNHAEFSVGGSGVLAYSQSGLAEVRLGWFDRAGNKIGTVDGVAHMAISPDDSRVASDRLDPQTGMRDIWVFDQRRGTRTRLTFSPANDWVPVWSPDGTRVAYTSDRENPGGSAHIYTRPANGSEAEEILLKTDLSKHHMDWSRDGRFLVFESNPAAGNTDLWLLPMSGPREPKLILGNPHVEAQPSVSPDGGFLAYASNESGVFEVYVQTFPESGGRWQISTSGGVQPLWRRDGKEMYYLAANGQVMALDVDVKTPVFGMPRALFQTSVAGEATTEHFAVTSDGQRFLLQDASSTARTGITVVLNWTAELVK